jgi:hypothetical protein
MVMNNRGWMFGLGAVGVVGLGVSATFAVLAKNKWEDSKGDCDLDDVNNCGANGIQMRNDARTRGDIATVSFVVGGAALAGAGVVWLLSGSSPAQHAHASRWRAAPVFSPGSAALFVQGDY